MALQLTVSSDLTRLPSIWPRHLTQSRLRPRPRCHNRKLLDRPSSPLAPDTFCHRAVTKNCKSGGPNSPEPASTRPPAASVTVANTQLLDSFRDWPPVAQALYLVPCLGKVDKDLITLGDCELE